MNKIDLDKTHYILAALTAVFIISTIYLWTTLQDKKDQYDDLTNNNNATKVELSSTTNSLTLAQAEISQLTGTLEETSEELDDAEKDLKREKKKNDNFEDQIEDLADTVGDLDKLSKTDEELLEKYSKVYFLNENYIPSKIKQIDDDYVLAGKDAMFFHGDALPFLEEMLEDAADDDINLKIISAYRSFDQQTELKGQFTQVYGSGANAFSADQGYSEHQLGTTIDVTDPATAGTYTSFADTEAYAWLQENAHKYGFTLSYPEANGFYVFEPWHWRFVGVDLAKDLYKDDVHFYDLDQRDIDKYLISIFD